MTSMLPVISTRETIKAFSKVGFEVIPGRGKGSHVVMHKPNWPTILTIPDRRELRRGTLRSLIRDAGLTVEEFNRLVHE